MSTIFALAVGIVFCCIACTGRQQKREVEHEHVQAQIPRREPPLMRLYCGVAADVELFAIALHEAGREAVNAGATVNPTGERFLEWDEVSEQAREGRRIQARQILKNFCVYIP